MSKVSMILAGLTMVGMIGGCGGSGSSLPKSGHFTCKINGQDYVAAYRWVREDTENGRLEIWAVDAAEKSYVEIKVPKPSSLPATFQLENVPERFGLYDLDESQRGGEYYTYNPANSSITINTLTEEGCSGTFSFRARNNVGEEVLVEGSFDVEWGGAWE